MAVCPRCGSVCCSHVEREALDVVDAITSSDWQEDYGDGRASRPMRKIRNEKYESGYHHGQRNRVFDD